MAIVKRPKSNGKTAYQVRWRHNPTRAQQSCTLPNYRDAVAMDAAIKTRRCQLLDTDPEVVTLALIGKGVVPDPDPQPAGGPTLGEALTARALNADTPGSRRAYAHLPTRIGDLAHVPLGEVTPEQVEAWFTANRDRYADNTLATTLVGLRSVLAAVDRSSVTAGIRHKGEREVVPNYLTDAQVELVIAAATKAGGDVAGLAVRTAATCGTRWGETFGLSVASLIDGPDPFLQVVSGINAKTRPDLFRPTRLKSKSSRRNVALPVDLAGVLAAHAAGRSQAEALFRPPRGQCFAYSTFRQTVWGKVRATPGIPSNLRFHDLRHTAAKRWLDGGAQLGDVSLALGHSDITITHKEYGAFEHGRQDRIRAAMGSGFGGQLADRRALLHG